MAAMRTLHVTNGESAGGTLRASGVGGDVVCWDDALHEGPVPGDLGLDALTKVRARFLAEMGPASFDEVLGHLQGRDRALQGYERCDEVCLWFEHDLYDQLQLLQVLDWFHGEPRGDTQLSLICIGEHAEVPEFHGLGQLTTAQMAGLWPTRQAVVDAELETAHLLWRAFRSPHPGDLLQGLQEDVSALPFMRAALVRHLQEYPWVGGGLARGQRQLLESVRDGAGTREEMFVRSSEREEARYLGDTTCFAWIEQMAGGERPLLREEQGRYELTELGRAVLEGRADAVTERGVSRWLGGVFLVGTGPVWRWDGERGTLVGPRGEVGMPVYR